MKRPTNPSFRPLTSAACPKCGQTSRQVKSGFTPAGSQRLRCKLCGCRYTPAALDRGYGDDVREQALTYRLEGYSFREIGRLLEVNHQTVANWIHAYANRPPSGFPLELIDMARLDGLL